MSNLGLLNALVAFIALGFLTFVVLYVVVAKAHKNPFGRHFLSFTAVFLAAFVYALFGQNVAFENRILGWTIVMVFIAIVVWAQVILLVNRLHKGKKEKV